MTGKTETHIVTVVPYECGNDRAAYRVPSGIHLLLLKLGELPPVVDDHEQLQDEQQRQADQHDARHHARYNGDDVRTRRALCRKVGEKIR